VLGETQYRDKVYACWLGKNIGGTLGAPFECHKYVNDLSFYEPVPTEPLPNDDLDFQLVWLSMVEERGADLCVADFAGRWRRHLQAYPWNEYGFAGRNLDCGLQPPVSGWFENYYVDEMGSPIRSEIWACLAPADPQRAAALAWMDSALDHAGGEGMWGEMFWAAVESAAFVISDPLTLIRLGLAMIPPSCNIARVTREAVWMNQHGIRWAEARQRIVAIYGNDQPCNALQNHGFTLLGWLYGKDFGDCLCKAVNCGYDTDCTGATLGALLGIIGGTAAIPKRWSEPIGTSIVLHKYTHDLDAPKDLEELTERTVTAAARVMPQLSPQVVFGNQTQFPESAQSSLFHNELAMTALHQDLRMAVVRDRELQLSFHYGGDPVFYPGETRQVRVSCEQHGTEVTPQIQLSTPAHWQVQPYPVSAAAFLVTPRAVPDIEQLTVTALLNGVAYTGQFAALSPARATGYASARNVPRCPECAGRAGACHCR
jgi:ADP-ribosylglycohydrolase